MGLQFPNESAEYRSARNELLKAEAELRINVEAVAKLRRSLPKGGQLKEDYVFDELVNGSVKKTKLSELFSPGKNSLFIYNFMYGPDMDAACPMCTSLLDGLNGQMFHANQQINTAVVAKNPIEKLVAYAESRNWTGLRLLSSANNSYNVDYFGEIDGHQNSTGSVFERDGEEIRHFWGMELQHEPVVPGQNPRHTDQIWPLWNLLDFTRQGRGDWYPSLSYNEPVKFLS